MKKILAVIVTLLLSLSMVLVTGCGGVEGSKSNSDDSVGGITSKIDGGDVTVSASKADGSSVGGTSVVTTSKTQTTSNPTTSTKSTGTTSSTKSNSTKSSSTKSSSTKSSSTKSSSTKSSSTKSSSTTPVDIDPQPYPSTVVQVGALTPVDAYAAYLPKTTTIGGAYPTAKSGDLYVSTTGNDSNVGSEQNPLKTLATAVAKATAGTTIFMAEGTYPVSTRIDLLSSGTASAPITIQAKDWKKVILDYTEQPYGFNDASYCGIIIKGNYWHIQGLTICHAGDNGIKVEGSYNYIGRCILHHNGDTGIQLGFGHHTNVNNPGNLCGYNTIENCDSYLNYDFDNWGDADGFACKMHNGKDNVFIGCRAWRNCDDAWDLYETKYSVYIINCWSWESGNKTDFSNDKYFSDSSYLAKKSGIKAVKRPSSGGNGNGIKLGGNGEGGNSEGVHYVINCVSFGHDITSSVKGFDENSHKGGVILENNVGWDNGYNYMFENGGSNSTFKNNISFYTGNGSQPATKRPGEIGSGANLINNNFVSDGGDLNMNITVTADDFISLNEKDALEARQANGALPINGFAQLKTTSSVYNSGMGRYKN